MIKWKASKNISLSISLLGVTFIIHHIIDCNILSGIIGMRHIQAGQSIAHGQKSRDRFDFIVRLVKGVPIQYFVQDSRCDFTGFVVYYGDLEVVVIFCRYHDFLQLLLRMRDYSREGYCLERCVAWHVKLVLLKQFVHVHVVYR